MKASGVAVSLIVVLIVVLGLATADGTGRAQVVQEDGRQVLLAQATAATEPSPEEKMRRRYPQPVKVGDLLGLPVLDWRDSTIGFVRRVVRTPQGKIQLVVNNGYLFGWGGRLVPVPIETVAILGRQIAALDMEHEAFAAAPTWSEADGRDIPAGEMIRIAITRR
jgi:hypothetical protein